MCISSNADANIFTQGFNEEPKHQLFKELGKIIILELSFSTHSLENKAGVLESLRGIGVTYLLEGRLKIDHEGLRVSSRLVEIGTGCTVWSENFDQC